MSEPVDVLVVGGGLVGSSLAVALAHSSLSLALVEPLAPGSPAQPSFDDRCTALAPTSRGVFQALGAWPAISPEAAPIRRIHVSERGGFGFTRLRAQDHGLDALGHVVPNRCIGAALAPLLASQANLQRHCPAAVARVEAGDEFIEARLEDGTTLRARLLVVADGADSATRRGLGIAVRQRNYGQAAVIANLTPARDHQGTAFERFTADGPLALLPLTAGRCALVRSLPRDQLEAVLALDDAAFRTDVQRRFGWRLGRLLQVGARSAYPLRALQAERLTAPRAVLLGNAAHTLHPVAGQGFNLALRDVARLAEALHQAAIAGTDPGAAGPLEEYQHEARADLRRTMGFTDVLVRGFGGLAPLAPLRSAALLALDRVPPARRAFARLAMGRAAPLPRLARGLPLAEGAA